MKYIKAHTIGFMTEGWDIGHQLNEAEGWSLVKGDDTHDRDTPEEEVRSNFSSNVKSFYEHLKDIETYRMDIEADVPAEGLEDDDPTDMDHEFNRQLFLEDKLHEAVINAIQTFPPNNRKENLRKLLNVTPHTEDLLSAIEEWIKTESGAHTGIAYALIRSIKKQLGGDMYNHFYGNEDDG
tara:strand:+ start:1750 stop:2292 length:543 start_codon:yes stop_codon:yes gene_type:complete